MAGYLITLNDESSLAEIVKSGFYSTIMSSPKYSSWGISHEGTFADYLSMKAGDFVFFFVKRKGGGFSPRARMKQAARRHEYTSSIRNAQPVISKHKCAICGRTSEEYPDLEFRFCSKCNGNYEYCSEHLFTHKHVE